MDVSSARSFVIDGKFLLRSLVQIKKERGPKMEPWRTSTIIGNHVEDLPLSNTHWYLLHRKLYINFNRGTDIQIDLILQKSPLSQTLLVALDISEKTLLTSRVGCQSKEAYISRQTDRSWLSHNSEGVKPECFALSKLLLWRKSKI